MPSKAEYHLRNPEPGCAIEASREFGVDLALLIERLRLTPDERVCTLQKSMIIMDQIRGIARKTANNYP